MQNQSAWAYCPVSYPIPAAGTDAGKLDITLSQSDDDDLIIVIEDEQDDACNQAELDTAQAWKVLIADDDASVHEVTVAALSGQRVHDRPLSFLHAYSASETVSLLHADHTIDLVLLDVVMESPDAGLRAVKTLRETPGLQNLKIVIRTGQPGHAPEQEVRRSYAIDGYAKKAELTRSLLHDVIATALRPTNMPPESSH